MTDRGEAPSGARNHYSYTHYADQAVAEGFDALRFGGPIGKLPARDTRTFAVDVTRAV